MINVNNDPNESRGHICDKKRELHRICKCRGSYGMCHREPGCVFDAEDDSESIADQTEELEKESDEKTNLTNKPDGSKLIEYDNKYIIEKANQIINEARESNWSIVIKLADGIKDAAWWRKNRTDE